MILPVHLNIESISQELRRIISVDPLQILQVLD
jgi:hypothetical protein